jgi:hypothetical protein
MSLFSVTLFPQGGPKPHVPLHLKTGIVIVERMSRVNHFKFEVTNQL